METVTVRCWFDSETDTDDWLLKHKDIITLPEENKIYRCHVISNESNKPSYSKYEARILLIISNDSPSIECLINSMCTDSEMVEILVGDEFYVISLKE